jgi:hypothetical protein
MSPSRYLLPDFTGGYLPAQVPHIPFGRQDACKFTKVRDKTVAPPDNQTYSDLGGDYSMADHSGSGSDRRTVRRCIRRLIRCLENADNLNEVRRCFRRFERCLERGADFSGS